MGLFSYLQNFSQNHYPGTYGTYDPQVWNPTSETPFTTKEIWEWTHDCRIYWSCHIAQHPEAAGLNTRMQESRVVQEEDIEIYSRVMPMKEKEGSGSGVGGSIRCGADMRKILAAQ